MHVHILVYIMYMHLERPPRRYRLQAPHPLGESLNLYTILPSPIWYGIWHTKGVSVRGRILRNRRAIVLQYGRLYTGGGGGKKDDGLLTMKL